MLTVQIDGRRSIILPRRHKPIVPTTYRMPDNLYVYPTLIKNRECTCSSYNELFACTEIDKYTAPYAISPDGDIFNPVIDYLLGIEFRHDYKYFISSADYEISEDKMMEILRDFLDSIDLFVCNNITISNRQIRFDITLEAFSYKSRIIPVLGVHNFNIINLSQHRSPKFDDLSCKSLYYTPCDSTLGSAMYLNAGIIDHINKKKIKFGLLKQIA